MSGRRAILCALVLTACARQSEVVTDSVAHEVASATHDAAADQTRAVDQVQEQHVEAGPETITRVEEDYGPPAAGEADQLGSGGAAGRSAAAGPASSKDAIVPPAPRLVKRVTTTVQRGPVTASSSTSTHEQDHAAATAHDASADDTARLTHHDAEAKSTPQLPAVRCGFGGTVWGLVALLAIGGALALAWRLKRWPFG